ncbi:unnamed protein product [Urochloa humidicola]
MVADPPLALANSIELPADVLYEILLRFPAKEVGRLRLVCRSWRSLTSDPSFIRAHSSRHPLIAALRLVRMRSTSSTCIPATSSRGYTVLGLLREVFYATQCLS